MPMSVIRCCTCVVVSPNRLSIFCPHKLIIPCTSRGGPDSSAQGALPVDFRTGLMRCATCRPCSTVRRESLLHCGAACDIWLSSSRRIGCMRARPLSGPRSSLCHSDCGVAARGAVADHVSTKTSVVIPQSLHFLRQWRWLTWLCHRGLFVQMKALRMRGRAATRNMERSVMLGSTGETRTTQCCPEVAFVCSHSLGGPWL